MRFRCLMLADQSILIYNKSLILLSLMELFGHYKETTPESSLLLKLL